MFRCCVTYSWKDLGEGYNFALDLTLIKGVHKKLQSPKVVGVPILGVSRQNDIWVALWLGIEHIIRGNVVTSPSSSHGESCESVFTCSSFVHQKCSNYALTNLLFGLCMSMWIIDLFVTLPNPHPRALAHPSTPKVLQVGSVPRLLVLLLFSPIRFVIESIKEFRGASIEE
jgi:hypothetical protein